MCLCDERACGGEYNYYNIPSGWVPQRYRCLRDSGRDRHYRFGVDEQEVVESLNSVFWITILFCFQYQRPFTHIRVVESKQNDDHIQYMLIR